MKKSTSLPSLCKSSSTPSLTVMNRRKTLFSFPGAYISRKVFFTKLQEAGKSRIFSEEHVYKLYDTWTSFKNTLHIMEEEASFITRHQTRLAIGFYEGLLNPDVATDVLEKIIHHFQDIQQLDHDMRDIYNKMLRDLQHRKFLSE